MRQFAREEERIIRFWNKNDIFKKVTQQNKGKKNFVFYEGPPSANGAPGLHHVLSRSFKDVIIRYKTMRGYYVPRKAGWDTHGLPIEIALEKRLGFTHKNQIEAYGIAKFNRHAQDLVWEYKTQWDKLTKRMGFWLDLDHPYITYTADYIESLWSIIKRMHQNGLLYEDFKVIPYCPRCETPLSSHEVAQGYKTVSDESAYVKFAVNGQDHTYLLAWTTTPWTLPANAALAIGKDITYVQVQLNDSGEQLILAEGRLDVIDQPHTVVRKLSAKDLQALTYEPLWDLGLDRERAFHIAVGDFVSDAEGTGIVHLAPFGADDMKMFRKYNIPFLVFVNGQGAFDFSGVAIADSYALFHTINQKFVRDANADILESLRQSGNLFNVIPYEHEYPFCWRCSSPLLYYPKTSWFVAVTQRKAALIKNNESIHWVPDNVKHGRFGEWLNNIEDWAFSRDRYWGTPLPIWRCAENHDTAIGSLKDLGEHPHRNTFILFRHGEAESNAESIVLSAETATHKAFLTPKGQADVRRSAEELAQKLNGKRPDLIVTSPLTRCVETAEIIRAALDMPRDAVKVEKKIGEINVGTYNGKSIAAYREQFANAQQRFTKRPPKGETLTQVKKRMMAFLLRINKKYQHKTIIIVSHGDPLWLLRGALAGMNNEQIAQKESALYLDPGTYHRVTVPNWPFDERGELNLHRPYVDDLVVPCGECSNPARRVTPVVDVWFDSGSMPFAQNHYPFEHADAIDRRELFPADYICEGVDQTRGWFYTLLAVSTMLGEGASYKHVISLGHLLDANGQKMSKSKGNVVDPWDVADRNGIDALRWYFYSISQPGDPKLFNQHDLQTKQRMVLDTADNVLSFLKLYATPNDFRSFSWTYSSRNMLDRWIMSRMQYTVRSVTQSMDAYDITTAARVVEQFIDELSNWYVRRSRRRAQKPESRAEYEAFIFTLFSLLYTLSVLTAPFIPFWAESAYQDLRKLLEKNPTAQKHMTESVHLDEYPVVRASALHQDLEQAMARAREIVSLALQQRAAAKIKIRQPLAALIIGEQSFADHPELLAMIGEEVNVKTVTVKPVAADAVILDTVITPELEREGWAKDLVRHIQDLRKREKLMPRDTADVVIVRSSGDQKKLEDFLSIFQSQIKTETNTANFILSGVSASASLVDATVGEWQLKIGIQQ